MATIKEFNEGTRCKGVGNAGNNNTGSYNTGWYNTGWYNTGSLNTGCYNLGTCNTGEYNVGNYNAGQWNVGNCNAGDSNTGNNNTGHGNVGHHNAGDWNVGYCNTGNCNTSNYNTGDWNKTDFSSGFFTNIDMPIYMFNKPTSYKSYSEIRNLRGIKVLNWNFKNYQWINSDSMTEKEKENHPEYELLGGYSKNIDFKTACRMMWDNLNEEDKKAVIELPNFDAQVFEDITGIDINKN